MKLVSFKGIYPFKKKETAGLDLIPMRSLDFYSVPLKLKGITEADPIVRVGDDVKQGFKIAKAAGKLGVNIYSPVSGKVLNIYDKVNAYGDTCRHILIKNDYKNEVQDLPAIDSVSDVSVINRLRDSGMIDNVSFMPTYLKYAFVGARSYKTLIILLDSTDPNCTVNQTLAEYRMEEVVNGAKYFMNITSASLITFVFTEANYKLAMKFKKHILDTKKNYDFKIKFIPNKYPFDNPYILTNLITGKKITKKLSFLDAGVVIENAESCYNLCRAVEFNKPVISKIITVDGDNITRKGNYIVPNGVPYEKLIDFAGIENKELPVSLIEGHLLSGFAQYNKEISTSLSTNCLLYLTYNNIDKPKEYPCISCGKCAQVCPMFLKPNKIEQAYLDEDPIELEALKFHSCIDCGCCSFVCPSKRHVAQRIMSAKYYDKANRGAK